MLTLFQDSSLCPSWQRVMEKEESKNEDCLSRWSGEDWLPLPFCKFKDNLCAATSYVTSLLNTTCIIITRPHLCMQPCKQGEWGEWVHLPCVTPGFQGYWKTRNNRRTEYRNNGITFNYRKWKCFELSRHGTCNCHPARYSATVRVADMNN